MTEAQRPHRSQRLINRQLRKAGLAGRNDPELERFLELIEETYDDFDRARQLSDRANRLASEELAATMASLDASERLFRSLARCSPNGIVYSDHEGRCLYANDRADELFGVSDGLRDGSWLDWVVDEDRPMVVSLLDDMQHGSHRDVLVEHRIAGSLGEVVWVSTSASLVEDAEDDSTTGWVALFEDITDRKRYEQQLAALARNDSLTQLNNRYSLSEKLDQLCEHLTDGDRLAVAVIDLDRFKLVNDTFGHEAGDQLLVSVARKLEQATRSGDIVARLGGDEFAFVCSLSDKDDVADLGRRLSDIIHGPVTISGRTLHVAGSVGVAVAGPGELSPDELLRNADAAMYQAKRSAIITSQVFDESFVSEVARRFDLEGDVREAVRDRSITLEYQPILNAETGAVLAVEAFARFVHPTLGAVEPTEFIEVAEDLGLIHELGEQLLDLACEQLARWRAEGAGGLTVSVNVSGLQLRDPNFPWLVRRVLRRYELPAAALMLEFDEGVVDGRPTLTLQTLSDLRAMGVRFAVDDFGDGPLSLQMLGELDADHVKIGQHIVGGIRGSGPHLGIKRVIESVVDLARRFDMTPIGEGIETEDQRRLLRDAGCVFMQGHLFTRPLPADDDELCRLLSPEHAG